MIRACCAFAAVLALPVAAFGQVFPSTTFNNLTIQGDFTASAGTVFSGALITPSGGSSVAQGDNIASFDLVGGRSNFLKQLQQTTTNSPTVFGNLANQNAANLTSYGLYQQLGTASFTAQQQWNNAGCPLTEWGPSLAFSLSARIINN